MADESAGDEILYRAEVEDLTKEFFERFDKNITEVSNKAEAGFKTVDNTVKGMGSTMAIVGGVVAGLTTKLVDYAIQMSDKLLDFLADSEKVAEGVEAVGASLKIVGENSGYSMMTLKELTEQLEKVGLSTSESRTELLKMIQAELDLKDSSKLAQVAVDAAAVGNTSSAQAMERIIQAITYQSPRMLKSLGLVVDFQGDMKRASQELGRELTDTEKKQIALNSVLEQGKKISGAYAESLETTLGQRKLQAELIDKIREEAGAVFTQSAYESLKAANEVLRDIFDYLTEHKDDLDALSDDFATLTKSVISITEQLLKMISIFGTPLKGAIEALAEFRESIGQSGEVADIFIDGMRGMSQAASLFAGALAADIQAADNLITVLTALAKHRLGFMSEEDYQKIRNNLPSIKEAFENAFMNASAPLREEKVDLDNVTEATNNAAEAAENLAEINADKLAKAVETASVQLKKLKESQEEAAATRAIKAQRDAIEEELRLQWDREDQERRYAETIQSILENAEDQRSELTQRAADARLQIEVDYRRRLQDMLDDYNREASELARKRDAVGMLALARKYKSDLEKEKKSYEERKEAADKSYKETMEALNKSTQEQLEKAEKARQKELEDYQRSLERQAELKRLHDQWDQEDRDRQLQKTLEDLVKGFSSMDGMTQEGLNQLLQIWGTYFQNLNQIIANGVAEANNQYAQLQVGGGWSDAGVANYSSNNKNSGTVKGQSGLVSDLLTPGNFGNAAILGQAPAVSPSRGGYERRDINVRVDGNALDPHIQRVLVKSLEEIERNRG